MDWINKMNMVISYIENHLDDELEIEDISRLACVSTFHFYRLFDMLTGITVTEYIRRRRLVKAAQELSISGVRVIDVANKYGYSSPEAFSKAFFKLHGINPSDARKPGITLRMFPPLSFSIIMKGDKPMEYRIKKMENLIFYGKALRKIKWNEGYRIPEFWDECHASGTMEKMYDISGSYDDYGIYFEDDIRNETFSYMIAVKKPKDALISDEFETLSIPAATWAIFSTRGPVSESLEKLRQRIFGEWFMSSDYEHADAPSIEAFPAQQQPGNSPDFLCEIWIPIVKKS